MRVLWMILLTMLLSGCGYNDFQKYDEEVKADWAEVLNQYQRRYDLIPNLVEIVKGGKAMRRAIRTGRNLGDVKDPGGRELRDQVEVLSGLRQGEQVALPAGAPASPPAPNCPAPAAAKSPT